MNPTLKTILILTALTTIVVPMSAFAELPMSPRLERATQGLSEIANGRLDCNKLTARYADGNGTIGWTFVTIENGNVKVRLTHPEKDAEIHVGKLSDQQCRDLAVKAIMGQLWNVERTRKFAEANETQPRITLGVAGAGFFTVSQWGNDVRKTPTFAKTRDILVKLATDAIIKARLTQAN